MKQPKREKLTKRKVVEVTKDVCPCGESVRIDKKWYLIEEPTVK